jgi:hypothetical protein
MERLDVQSQPVSVHGKGGIRHECVSQEETVTDQLGSLMIPTNAADQSHVADPVCKRIDISNIVLKEKRRFIPNPKDKPCKQRKLQRAFEKRHQTWSTTEERWAMIAESLFTLLTSGPCIFDAETWRTPIVPMGQRRLTPHAPLVN